MDSMDDIPISEFSVFFLDILKQNLIKLDGGRVSGSHR